MHSLGETVGQEKWLLAGVVIRRFWTTGLVPCPSLCPDSSKHRVSQRRRQGQGPCRSRRQPTVPGTLKRRKAASQSTSCLQPGNHRIRKQREGIEDRTQQVCPPFQNKLFSFAARAHLHHNPRALQHRRTRDETLHIYGFAHVSWPQAAFDNPRCQKGRQWTPGAANAAATNPVTDQG